MSPNRYLPTFFVLFLCLTFLPARVTGQCNITDVVLSNIQCFPFGFGQVGFQLNVQGSGPSPLFNVSSPDGIIVFPGPYDYPNGTFINLEPTDINQNQFEIVVTDNTDPSCSFTVTLQNPCSGSTCQVSASLTGTAQCSQPGNLVGFDLIATGSGLGSGFNISSPDGSILDPGPFGYNSPTFFNLQPVDPGQSQFEVVVTDVDDPNCTTTITIANPCSCGLTGVLISSFFCDGLGTSDPNDDVLS
ncbi:MAG: hypothetical protein HRU12_17560, partial [Phaeodactylibacter sp.]|nr:hypothetical protein [Phaeodactylibacter sp.]